MQARCWLLHASHRRDRGELGCIDNVSEGSACQRDERGVLFDMRAAQVSAIREAFEECGILLARAVGIVRLDEA